MLDHGTRELIDGGEYPMTTEDLVAAHGDREIPIAGETLGEVLGRLDTETFERAEDARYALYTAVCGDAVGRKGYSDRDPTVPGSPFGPDQVSF